VRAVVAGADALLMPPVPDAAFEALQAAVKSGRISKERLDASVRRILQAKARLGLNKNKLVDVNAINQKFGSAAWQKEAQEISDRGVTHAAGYATPAAPGWNKAFAGAAAGVLRRPGALSGRRSRAANCVHDLIR